MLRLLSSAVIHSRFLLILGLVAGVALPGLAAAMAPYLPQLVAMLLVLAAFRVGAKPAFGALGDLAWVIPAVLILQVGVPVALALCLMAAGLAASPLALAVVLATAAPTLSGGASLAIVLRQDPARMMQLLVLGTAVFPATVLVVLSVYPIAETEVRLTEVGLRALGTIAAATALGFALRHGLLPRPTEAQSKAIDGALVLFFALIVIGLMAALGPLLRDDPGAALRWLIAAFALSFGLQAATIALLRKGPLAQVAGPLALAVGNRNVALFLVALPAEIVSPIMVFVACWQVPMYLTPILLPRLYAHVPAHE